MSCTDAVVVQVKGGCPPPLPPAPEEGWKVRVDGGSSTTPVPLAGQVTWPTPVTTGTSVGGLDEDGTVVPPSTSTDAGLPCRTFTVARTVKAVVADSLPLTAEGRLRA